MHASPATTSPSRRSFRLLLLGLLLGSVARPVQAQRTVPVSEEPRHHPVFENAVVRVFDVVVPPGDTTLYHVHANDYTFVSIGAAELTAQALGAAPVPLDLRDGQVGFSPPLTHRVSNHGSAPFHNLTIELLSHRAGTASLPPIAAGDSVVLDNARLRVVRSVVGPNETHSLPSDERTLLVFLSTGELHLLGGADPVTISAHPGTFHWMGERRPARIHNASAGPVTLLSFTVK